MFKILLNPKNINNPISKKCPPQYLITEGVVFLRNKAYLFPLKILSKVM